jgi:CRISPR/Cas system CSM-associated protein Csm2 small subunit
LDIEKDIKKINNLVTKYNHAYEFCRKHYGMKRLRRLLDFSIKKIEKHHDIFKEFMMKCGAEPKFLFYFF